MGVYDRTRPGGPKNLGISYQIPRKLAQQFGVKPLQREPAGSDEREAARLLARRRKEVRDGNWLPRKKAAQASSVRSYGEPWIEKRKRDGVKGVRDEEQRLRDFVFPQIGRMPMADVGRDHIVALMGWLRGYVSLRTKKLLAPRTQRHIYMTAYAMFEDAVADGVILANPCTLKEKRGELPKKKDSDPRWRSQAIFTRPEVTMLISDARVPRKRRVLYGLIFLGGLRVGEAVARQWLDYDTAAEPLGKLIVATQHDDDDLKTEDPRAMPVHPVLAQILASWRADYARECGRKPAGSALIVPNEPTTRAAHLPIDGKRVWYSLQRDLIKLGLRRRRVHDLRRTFVTLALADGADKYLLKFCTHGRPKGDAFDDYVTPPWEKLCAEVAKLKISIERREE